MIGFKLQLSSRRNGEGRILIRIHEPGVDICKSTSLSILPEYWSQTSQTIKRRVVMPAKERAYLETHLKGILSFVKGEYRNAAPGTKMSSEWLGRIIEKYWSLPSVEESSSRVFPLDDLFDEFVTDRGISKSRTAQYMVAKRILQRYEMVMRTQRGRHSFRFDVAAVTPEDVERIRNFIAREHLVAQEFPDIYESIPDKKQGPHQRGHNTVIDIMKKLRAFFNWCEKKQYIDRSPFGDVSIGTEIYGTPYYLTKEEKQRIWMHEFSDPYLERQRDVFIFQCSIGCRVGDLYRLRKSNIIDGCVQYIPAKTIKDSISTVVVPLNRTAQAILRKYDDLPGGHILPLVLKQDYNVAIKAVLGEAGVTRWVSIVDPVTMTQVTRRINEVASSHMARRTFVGNLYREVKDPSLIASMSGHKEDSRAFSRYRAIDTDIKKQLVSLLD